MEKDIRKKLVIPFIAFLGFITVSASSLYKGIVHHETWRVVMASFGGSFFLVFIGLIIYTFIKSKRQAG